LVCKNINPSPIKKIINKKVTQNDLKDHSPVKKCSLPNFPDILLKLIINLFQTKRIKMRSKDSSIRKQREHHPQVSIGLFLVTLGLALLVATNDMLHLGSIKEYFTWETAMIFVGVLLVLNLQFTGGLLLIAGGTWFLLDQLDYELPELIKTIYWPSVIILVGLGFIISSFIKGKRNIN